MNVVYLISGIVVLLLAVVDGLWTTLVGRGGGPITRHVTRAFWVACLRLHRRRPSHLLLTAAGPAILAWSMMLWIVLVWLGWLLIFLFDASSVVSWRGFEIATFWEKAYYVGFSAYTLGTGDFVPNGEAWRILTIFSSLNGFLMATLAVTYALPVVSASTQQRQLAGIIDSLGDSPQQIVLAAWNGRRIEGLEQHFAQIGSMIELHAQRHLSYPVLHFFHSPDPNRAIAVKVALLHEALLLLHATDLEARPATQVCRPPLRSIGALMDLLAVNFIHPTQEAPAAPRHGRLIEAGFPIDSERLQELLGEHEYTRRLLWGYVLDSGWSWDGLDAAD